MTSAENWVEFIRVSWPNVTEEEAETLLWNTTCFPFGGFDAIRKNLDEMFERSGGNVMVAVEMSYNDISTALENARQKAVGGAPNI